MMKRTTLAVLTLALSTTLWAQSQPNSTQNPPSAQPGAGQSATPQQGTTPAQPSGKRPLQAKTQAEYEAYNTAKNSSNDPAAMEKAADDFAAKFPDSELR